MVNCSVSGEINLSIEALGRGERDMARQLVSRLIFNYDRWSVDKIYEVSDGDYLTLLVKCRSRNISEIVANTHRSLSYHCCVCVCASCDKPCRVVRTIRRTGTLEVTRFRINSRDWQWRKLSNWTITWFHRLSQLMPQNDSLYWENHRIHLTPT